MSSSTARSMLLVLAAVAALAVAGCGGGGGGSGGSGGPASPPVGPDRSGTWTLRVTPSSPCAGDPASFTIVADLVQTNRTLLGSGCSAGNAADVSLALSGADNSHFSGTVRGCASVNADCQAPYVFGSCVRVSFQGDISGTAVSGTYSAGSSCNASGTFTGTIT
jgi:hypothetical protein